MTSDLVVDERALHRVESLSARYGLADWVAELHRVEGSLFSLTVRPP